MMVTVIQTVNDALGTISKVWGKGQKDSEIKGLGKTIKTTGLRSARILRIMET